VPPPPPGDEPGLAWSVVDDSDEMSTNRHGQLIWAGLVMLVVAITAALVLLVSTLFGRHATNSARPEPVTSPPVTTTVAASPPPPTVTAPPPVTRHTTNTYADPLRQRPEVPGGPAPERSPGRSRHQHPRRARRSPIRLRRDDHRWYPHGVALATARGVAVHRRKRRDVVSLHIHGGLLPAD